MISMTLVKLWRADTEAIGWLGELGVRKRYGRGEWIHGGHDAPDAIYLVYRGRVGVAFGGAGAVMGAGDWFGELFLDDELRGSYLARALEESEVWVVRRERFSEALREKGLGRLRGLIGYKRDLILVFK